MPPTALDDYQFELDRDPRVPFGHGHGISVESFDPGGIETRDQDVLGEVSDVRHMGTDRKTPPVWSWNLYTDVYTEAAALALLEDFTEVWDAEEERVRPATPVPLRYTVAGRTRVVYGRPRNFDYAIGALMTGKLVIACDYALMESRFYDVEVQSSEWLTVGAAPSGDGFTDDFGDPLTGSPEGTPATGSATVGGRRATWATLVVEGPVVDPWFVISGTLWGMRGELQEGESVTLSGAPWSYGVKHSNGLYLPDFLDPNSMLSDLRLRPGTHALEFGGWDATGTARARLLWQPAYGAM